MRIHCICLALASLLAASARAQAPARADATSSLGTWRGTSVCLVRPSPCNDEVVVYRITRSSGRDSVAIDARKIVRGQEEEMGVIDCGVGSTGSADVALTCSMRNGVWRFTVRRDSLVGELRLPDSTRFRDVRTARAH